MLSSAPAAAYLATRVFPSSITSGGLLPAKAVSSLVPTSPHCWICTSTLTLGCFAVKSELTPSMTDCGAEPFISQTVRVPLSFWVLVEDGLPEQAVAISAIAAAATTRILFGLIFVLFISSLDSFLGATGGR